MKTRKVLFGMIVVLTLLLNACSPAATQSPTQAPVATQAPATTAPQATTAPTSAPAATEAPTTAATAAATSAPQTGNLPKELADAMASKYKGTTVSAFGAFAGADEVKFNDNVKAFEAATGITIQYESSKQFEATI